MTIKLNADQRKGLIAEVKKYFLDEHDEDYGDLRAGFVLDFFVEHLGPVVYNQAITDAVTSLQSKIVDLEGELFEQPPRDRTPKKR